MKSYIATWVVLCVAFATADAVAEYRVTGRLYLYDYYDNFGGTIFNTDTSSISSVPVFLRFDDHGRSIGKPRSSVRNLKCRTQAFGSQRVCSGYDFAEVGSLGLCRIDMKMTGPSNAKTRKKVSIDAKVQLSCESGYVGYMAYAGALAKKHF